jgi:hypothetical protein
MESKSAMAYAIAMGSEARTALLIRCSKEEAARLRGQARAEHRSVSGCLLNVLERSLRIEEKYAVGYRAQSGATAPALAKVSRFADSRAELFLRCSQSEAERIRGAAKRRNMSISRFVIFCLQRHWKAMQEILRTGQ